MGRGHATPTSKSARCSVARAPSASYARRHSMITRSRTVQVVASIISTTPLSSVSAPNATVIDHAIDVVVLPLDPASTPSTPLSIADPGSSSSLPHHLSSVSAPNATVVDNAANVDPTFSPSTSLSIADSGSSNSLPSHSISDEDHDDTFHDEVRIYLDHSSDILRAQAEEVKLLRREVASAREEKAALKSKHAADVTAREQEYGCPICYELLWDPPDYPVDIRSAPAASVNRESTIFKPKLAVLQIS
ncbi:hypothetical protein EV368DRAFT_81492 [Lentinula lateritia]|nr:hypothetical protein EV368DRAFT_81492 [Lentinula lateritia]